MKENTYLICPNCGAEIDIDSTKCPYCGYINLEGAEKKFRSDINEIRDHIEEAKKEPSKALVKGFTGGTRIILIVVAVLAVLAGLYVAELVRETRDKPKLILSADDEAYASAYRETAGEQLAEAFDDRDVERMAGIFDRAYSQERVSLWGVPHYEAAYASSCYRKLQQCLAGPDGEKIPKKEAEEITYYCFYFYFRAYGEDAAEIFDPIRETEILPLLTGRLGYTVDEMEGFRDAVWDSTNVDRTKVYRLTKKRYRDYR
ncbi:MAG: zinc ribbon domain-containing protein [Lachnospiraceae bacterium]|nr:zinc ribbon domain-containing protein [Lachnospiraceae bacterium]